MSYAVDNHPFYLKLLAWHALIRTRNQCTMKTVEKALNDLILHFEYHFLKTVGSLTPKQLSFLKALVEQGFKLCSEAILKAYQLGSSGTVFIDPVFREWLQIRYFKID